MLSKIKYFFKNNWKILAVLILGSFLRLYRINHLATFLGEQGRDLLIARQILGGKLTLLGPPTSISNVHFGPFYHYFNALFLIIFNYEPVGPAVGFAVLSIISIYLIYKFAKNFQRPEVGLLAALLFSVSPLMVEQGKSMFNSSFIIYFSIYSYWAFSEYIIKRKILFLLLCGFFAGLSFQSNFLSVGLIISLVYFLFNQKIKLSKQIYFYIGAVFAVLPYLVFEFRHDFFNIRAFFQLSSAGKAVNLSIIGFMERIVENYYLLIKYSVGLRNEYLSLFISFLIIIGIIYLNKDKKRKNKLLLMLCVNTLIFGLVFISLYPGEMLQHYLGSLYFFIFVILAILFETLLLAKQKIIYGLLITVYLLFNLSQVKLTAQNGYNMPKGWTIEEVKKVSQIINNSGDKNYNIAALLDGDTRAYPYRYLLGILGSSPMGVEEYPQSNILYVLIRGNEDQVLNYPVWEVYSFLPGKIVNKWSIKDDINLFKLEKI